MTSSRRRRLLSLSGAALALLGAACTPAAAPAVTAPAATRTAAGEDATGASAESGADQPASGEVTARIAADAAALALLADEVPAAEALWVPPGTPLAYRAGGAAASEALPDPAIPERAAVVERRGDRVRVRLDGFTVRLLVWLDLSAAGNVIARPTELLPGPDDPSAKPDEPAVYARPGLPVDLVARDRGWLRVRNERWHIDAWVPTDAVAKIFTAQARPPVWTMDLPIALFDLHASPKQTSPRLARLGTFDLVAAPVLGPIDAAGWRLVTVETDYLRIRGYERAAPLDKAAKAGSDEIFGFPLPDDSETPHVLLAEGTCLRDACHGDVIGVLTRSMSVIPEGAETATWLPISILFPGFRLPVWVQRTAASLPPAPLGRLW